mgnify:CR=1 FL=1
MIRLLLVLIQLAVGREARTNVRQRVQRFADDRACGGVLLLTVVDSKRLLDVLRQGELDFLFEFAQLRVGTTWTQRREDLRRSVGQPVLQPLPGIFNIRGRPIVGFSDERHLRFVLLRALGSIHPRILASFIGRNRNPCRESLLTRWPISGFLRCAVSAALAMS